MTIPIIGIDVDDLHREPKDGLRAAADLGFRAVELATVTGDVAPEALAKSGRRHLSRYIEGLGLTLSALTADLPGLRFTDPGSVDERVMRTCAVLELAADLGVPVVTAAAGALTHPETDEASSGAVEALMRIGEVADARGVVFALRPSHDSPEGVADVLGRIACPSLRLGLDPASMVMAGVDPLAILRRLPDQIALCHARDATGGRGDQAGRETVLGDGEVDWVGVLAYLDAVEYRGPYILRRTESRDSQDDLERGRGVLKRWLPEV